MDKTRFHGRPLIAVASWLGIAAAALAAPSAFAFNVYTVGGDGACGYAFIQDAIDAAAANPGEDYVFIASNREYGDQHLVVTDQDIDIVGGFPDCTQLGDPGLLQTTIGGTSGHSVFEIEGSSHVYLSNLVITGAVMDDSHHGGGIYFGGEGGLTVRFSWVFLNQAGYGGGIAVNPSGPTTLSLIGSTVSANTALDTGGGIQIEGPTTLNFAMEAGNTNYIAQNAALGNLGDGGGIKVIGPAVANLASAVVDLNTAASGAGISAIATSQGPAYVNLYTSDPNVPVTLYGNVAQQDGGGVFLLSNGSNLAKLCAFDFAIDANTATFGGAIMAATDGNGDGSIAFLNSDGCDRPVDSVACTPGAACNELNDNVSSTTEGTGTIHVASAGALSASRFAMRRNTALSLIRFDADAEPSNGGGDYVHLHDCLLVDNTIAGNLLYCTRRSRADAGHLRYLHTGEQRDGGQQLRPRRRYQLRRGDQLDHLSAEPAVVHLLWSRRRSHRALYPDQRHDSVHGPRRHRRWRAAIRRFSEW